MQKTRHGQMPGPHTALLCPFRKKVLDGYTELPRKRAHLKYAVTYEWVQGEGVKREKPRG
jgi:hypothetical protein